MSEGIIRDVAAQEITPHLYEVDKPRVLAPGACITHQGVEFTVIEVADDIRAVMMRPTDIEPGEENLVSTIQNGYTMPPTSVMGERFIDPLARKLKKHRGAAVLWSPYGRGSENPNERIGRVTAEQMRQESARCLKAILANENLNQDPERRIVGGHSFGGQTSLVFTGDPEHYGFDNDTFDGALAFAPIPIPDSRMITARSSFRPNINLFTGPVKTGTIPVVKSLVTGKGVQFSQRAAEDFFFEGVDHHGQEEVLKRLFGDSAVYFLQTLISNSSRAVVADLDGKTVRIVTADYDPIVTTHASAVTASHLRKHGADAKDLCIPGGHFSSFYSEDLPLERPAIRKGIVMGVNQEAIDVVFSGR
jgi:predicted esterase